MGVAARRKAENEAIFRDVNEKLAESIEELGDLSGKTPFFCECEDTDCREVVRLDAAEYEQVRASPTTFLIVPGHPHETGNVVAEHDGYLVVDKKGEARRIALETDPRRNGG